MKNHSKIAILQIQAFASQLIPAFIGVLSFMLLVRNTKQEVLGQFIIYIAGVGLFEMIKSGGLQATLVMRLSGCTKEKQQSTIGSAYLLGGIISVSISLLLFIFYVFNVFQAKPGMEVFCGWYALFGLLTLPLHVAEATAVSRQDIKFLLWLRIIQSMGSMSVAVYSIFKEGSLQEFATIHLLFNAFVLLVVLVKRKTNPLIIFRSVVSEVKEMFKLLRYTLATLAATNALKSADTFLIGSLLGPKVVALYAIPLKLTELFEIPLRSLSTTAFPQLASENNLGNSGSFRKLFTQYLSWSYLIFIPALTAAFFMAPLLVSFIGGKEYIAAASVFQVFVIYGFLLPIDRLTGISLDALQKPKWNLFKVMIMALVNITGDLVAISYSGKLEWVAFITVLNVITGSLFGLFMLKKLNVVQPGNLLKDMILFMKDNINRILQRLSTKTSIETGNSM